ncbi:MAG: hypothetical protein IJC66_09910, partial [Kiritimatiellae bacterium]|nr:hypothetical protein [Kiritimatiellia bacterium]
MINAVNEQFSKFVSFAENRMAAGKDKAIASKGDIAAAGGTTLEERNIKTSNRFDWVSLSIFRWKGARNDNNAVRDIFKKCVADMFGGEKNIPESVRTAMLMKDYGCGKPLTARRIIAVRDAIANLERENVFDNKHDPDGELANKAFAAGYTRLDFGKLNTAANLCSQGLRISLEDAFNQVITKGSAANRTMNAGSLYMKDTTSFLKDFNVRRQIALNDVRNKTLATNFPEQQDTTSQLSKIAENLAYKFGNILNEAEELRKAANLPDDILVELRKATNDLVARMNALMADLSSGKLTDRRQICQKLFQIQQVGNLADVVKNSIVIPLKDAAKGNPAIAEFSAYVADLATSVANEYNELYDTYKEALAKDMAASARPRLLGAAHTAGMNSGRQVVIPPEIMDNLEGIIRENPFDRFDNINKLCDRLEKYGDSALRFNNDQKAALKALVEQTFGKGAKAEKMLNRLIDRFETSFFAEQLNDPFDFGKAKTPRPEMVVKHLQANPEALGVLEAGFKLDTDEDVEAVKNTLTKKLADDLKECLKITDVTQARCLSTGLMIQSLREYKPGFVTLDGQNIPNAQLGTKFPLLVKVNAKDAPGQKGYAEFLEKTFDAGHKKMRQTLSFVCGQADGLYGVIDNLLNFGGENSNLKGVPRDTRNDKGTVVV